MKLLHLDTDIATNIDDLCALALVLRWPDAELLGVTTVAEDRGRRAGCVRHVLKAVGRGEVPVAAGADIADRFYRATRPIHDGAAWWPEPILPQPGPVDDALDLLRESIDRGAVIAAIGPLTNLALLERRYPGILADAEIVAMGGWIDPPREGYPQRGPQSDWNVQSDPESALLVFEKGNPLLVPLSVTVETALRRSHLDRLDPRDPLHRLLLRQVEAWIDHDGPDRGSPNGADRLPDDFIAHLHDVLACGVALGWRDAITLEVATVRSGFTDGFLRTIRSTEGTDLRMVGAGVGEDVGGWWVERVVSIS